MNATPDDNMGAPLTVIPKRKENTEQPSNRNAVRPQHQRIEPSSRNRNIDYSNVRQSARLKTAKPPEKYGAVRYF